MNKFFLILISAIICTCATCQNEATTNATQAQTQVQTPPVTPEKKIISGNREKPSQVISPTHKSANNRNYYKSTARRARDIDTIYPYDIPVMDAAGKELLTSKAFAKNGKPTVLLFWLTTCVPCRYEMAAIQKKYEMWQEEADFNLYAISTDWPKNHERFYETVEKQQWPWETFLDKDREFLRTMPGRLNGLPQTFILDGNGKIVHHKRKYRTGDEDKLFEKIKEIAKKG